MDDPQGRGRSLWVLGKKEENERQEKWGIEGWVIKNCLGKVYDECRFDKGKFWTIRPKKKTEVSMFGTFSDMLKSFGPFLSSTDGA